MPSEQDFSQSRVIVVGASVRAAAWSALRAGLEPIGVDLFADLDLRRVAHARVVAADDYPDGLEQLLTELPAAPWLFTGGLENRPRLIERLSRRAPLWGNAAHVLRLVRSPFRVVEALQKAGLPCPAVHRDPPGDSDRRRWLLKPRYGAGGRGIVFWSQAAARQRPVSKNCYFQEWIEGEPCAAIFLGLEDGTARFLGATRQLIGLSWLGAGPFQYCGSIGPLPLSPALAEHYQRLGGTLVHEFGLRGLFGVDCVVQGDVPWPVEINPRCTASTEIIEWALRRPLLADHARVFGAATRRDQPPQERASASVQSTLIGKGVLFAGGESEFPQEGPWCETLSHPWQPWTVPQFADIPAAGRRFQAGEPILTMYARGTDVAECLENLRRRAVIRWSLTYGCQLLGGTP